jgi:hypothetical protein
MTIKVTLKDDDDIHFYICVDYLYPETTPHVKCMSNVDSSKLVLLSNTV